MISIEKSNIGTTLLPKMTTTGWDNINQLVTGSNSQDHTGMEFKFLGLGLLAKNPKKFFLQKIHFINRNFFGIFCEIRKNQMTKIRFFE